MYLARVFSQLLVTALFIAVPTISLCMPASYTQLLIGCMTQSSCYMCFNVIAVYLLTRVIDVYT